MAPKKRAKKEKKAPPKIITKTEYVTMVAERNAILANERRKTNALEDIFFNSEKNYDKEQVDTADIVKYLHGQIENDETEIGICNEKVSALRKELIETDKHYESIFNEIESAYEEKRLEFQERIEQLNAKIFASEETKKQRDDFLEKKEFLERSIHDMRIRQEMEIYEAEKLAIIKQDTMQKSMEMHLTSLVVDFRQASDFTIGETINMLVRDNIALGNMLTCMQETIEKARKSYLKVATQETHYQHNAELTEKEHERLLIKHDAKIFNIQSLIKSQEELYERIRSYQKLIKGKRRLLRLIAEEECLLREKNKQYKNLIKVLSDHENTLNAVENKYYATKKDVMGLVLTIIDTAKRVKKAIDIENITHVENEFYAETDNKEDQEENLIRYKFKTRETAIEDIIAKLSSACSDTTLMAPSCDSYVTKINESNSTT